MKYQQIRDAAQRRLEGESTGAWRLADALAAEIPERPHDGGDRKSPRYQADQGSDITTLMADVAAELEAAEIETPAGGAYTVASLRELRLVALGWPLDSRYREAAFRTHQEAGSSDDWRRGVLRALCLAARTGDFQYRETTAIDDAAWATAVRGVQRKLAAGHRYPVAANDLRAALQRKRNTPPPDRSGTTVLDAIEELQEAAEHAKRAVQILSLDGQHIGDSQDALEGLRDSLRLALEYIDTLLTGGGVTDASLVALLEGEQA